MATVPSEITMVAGHKVTAAEWNTNVRDAVNFLLNTPFAQIYQNSAQSIANAPASPYPLVSFDTATFNNDGAWSSGANTRWTCQTGGTYRVSGQIAFSNNGTGVREAQLAVNASILQTFNASANSGVATQVIIPTFSMHFAVGDYITIGAYQNSGGALNLSAGPQSTFLSVKWESNL